MKDIMIVGDISIDIKVLKENSQSESHIEAFPADINLSVGNSTYNVAKALLATSNFPHIYSYMSDDFLGKFIVKQLKKDDISFSYMMHSLTNCNINLLEINKSGDKKIFFSEFKVNDPNKLLFKKIIRNSNKYNRIHFTHSKWIRDNLLAFRKSNFNNNLSCDFHTDFDPLGKDKDFISKLDIVFFSGKGRENLNDFCKNIIKLGPRFVVCTLGEKGSIVVDKKNIHIFNLPVDNRRIIDTVGAGDVFVGTFLGFYANDYTLYESVIRAHIQASYKCENKGLNLLYDKSMLNEKYNELKDMIEINILNY